MPAPRKYPDELMARAVSEVISSGRPVAQVARDLDIHPEALRKRRCAKPKPMAHRRRRASSRATSPRNSKNISKVNAELRRANSILKDASVLFAQALDPTRRR